MRHYSEHLRVPVSYWVLGWFLTLFPLASLVWGGLSVWVGVASYAVFLLVPALARLTWGHMRIEVTGGELRAGTHTLPLALAGHVRALDEARSAQLRGPGADPAALMLVRPYLRRTVYIEVTGATAAWPYWLVGTRRPEALAAAIERSRPQSRAGDPSVA